MIILKVTRNQDFTLSLEDTFLENPQSVDGQLIPLLSLLRVKLRPVSSSDMFNGKIYIYEKCHMQVSKNAIPCQAVCNQMEIDLIPNEIRNLKCKEKKSKQNFV